MGTPSASTPAAAAAEANGTCWMEMKQTERTLRRLAQIPYVGGAFANVLQKGGTPKWHGRFATRFARIDSRESFAIETPIFIARQADSHK